MTSPCLSNEKRNFQCVTLASVDFIKLPLIDILASHIKPVDLFNKIKSCSTLKLSQQQLKICRISPPDLPDYNAFDVTLLYTLIRNLCSLPCPAQGWGKDPKATDTQISDDIERLRLFRNNYYAHAMSAEISENEFKDIWTNLKLVINRIQSICNKDYEEELKKIEQSKFTHCHLDICKIILDAYANKQNYTDGEDRPDIYIQGENEILCGGTARFEADVKNVEPSSWSVKWQKRRGDDIKCIDTSMEKYNGSTKRKLVIKAVCPADEGEYQAVLSLESNGPDYRSRNTIRLHVIGDVPSVRIFVDSPVCFGSETTIKSEVLSILTPDKYEWQKSKDGNDFPRNGELKYFESTATFTCPFLVIPKTTFADKLYYRLLVWNRIGESVSNTIFLNVTGSSPNITTSLETNIKNRSVKLIGNVFIYDDSPGILNSFWTKNDEKIKTEESGGKLLEVNIDSPTLIIKNVSPDDAGEYQLTATNAVGLSTSDVIILDIPSVFVENIEDENNGGQRISVRIKSLPVPCHVQWIAKSEDDDNFTPIDIHTEEYKGSTVSFPHPVLVVRRRSQLAKKSVQIEVTNFIGKIVQEISGICQHKKTSFITFSNDLITKFPHAKLDLLAYLLRASGKVRNVEALDEPKSVLECFTILQKENLFSKRNVIFLQFLLKLTECDELNEICINYALNQKALCYFDNSSTTLATGLKNVKFHVKGDVDNYSNKEIDEILDEVADMLECEKRDILVNGVLPSMSFILVLLINETYTWRFSALNEQGCKKLRMLNIDYLIVGEDLFLLESRKGIVKEKIYKERHRDDGIEFTKLCNYLALKFPQEKLQNMKDFIFACGALENTMFLMTAKSAIECFSILLNEKLFSKNDIFFLLSLCKETECNELYRKCREYAGEQKSSSIQDRCQQVQLCKGHMYPGIYKRVFVSRSDVLKDDIFPSMSGEKSVQTSGDKGLQGFEENVIIPLGPLDDSKPSSILKKTAISESLNIKTATKDDAENYILKRHHPGTSFEGNGFKHVEFYLRGKLTDVSEDQIKEMQETVAAIVDDEAIIKKQEQYSLTNFSVVLSMREECMKKLIAINQQDREKLSRQNIDYFIAGFVTVYIERSTDQGYKRWIPISNIQENISDVDNYAEDSTASLINIPFTEDMSHLRHPTYNCMQMKYFTIPTDYIYHISCMTSDSLWISGFDGLFEINEKGIIIKKLETDFSFNGSHTITRNGELLFVRALDVYLLTTSGEIKKVCLGPLSPSCLHSSRINDDILVGSSNTVMRHNKQGKLLQKIKLDDKGNLLYGKVNYVIENQNGDIVVSDIVKKAVVSVNKSGRHQFDYKGGASQSGFIPCGVCSDVNGKILVCNSSPDDLSIHLLNQNGQYLMHLLTKQLYGFLKPRALCLDEMQNIYVGDKDKILVVTYLTATEVKKQENKLMLSKV